MKLLKKIKKWINSKKEIDLEQVRLLHGRIQDDDL